MTQTDLSEHVRKLEKINRSLMGRVERSMDFAGTGFSLFQTAILLEDKVRGRTRDLENTLGDLSDAYAKLQEARDDAEIAKLNLTAAIEAVSEGFALFDINEALVMCNAPFRALMPDIGSKLVPGMAFTEMARLFSTSRHLVIGERQTAGQWMAARIDFFRKPTALFIQPFAGDRWMQISNKKTTAGATVIFQTDITDTVRGERIRRERELDEQSRILQATIDHLPQGICMMAKDLSLRAWNSRFIELLSLPVRSVTQHGSFRRVIDVLRGPSFAGANTVSRVIEDWLAAPTIEGLSGIEFRRSDSIILSLSANLTPDGGIVASFTDVTQERLATIALRETKETLEQRVEERTSELKREVLERRAIEGELIDAKNAAEEANKGKTQFLAAASHDLLQPLNAARIFLSLLTEAELDGRQSRLAQKADNAFGSVEQLLESLLDISRFDSGSVEMHPAPLSLDEMFDTLEAEFQPIADRKGLKLTCVRPSLAVMSDRGLLRRIVQNLLSNAIRYTETGRVLFGARKRGNQAVIEVWDTGPGIPADKTRVIFEEFRRLERESVSETKAMGLGLAIVDRISKLLGHTVNLRSVPGKGSCFSITVPLADALPAVAAPLARVRPRAANITAIIIENNLQILEGMVELLQARGIRAIPTVSGEEALEAMESFGNAPDLVIADYHLDRGTGLDALARIRHAAGRETPGIIITADRTAEVAAAVAHEGVALLRKPVKAALLMEEIDGLMA